MSRSALFPQPSLPWFFPRLNGASFPIGKSCRYGMLPPPMNNSSLLQEHSPRQDPQHLGLRLVSRSLFVTALLIVATLLGRSEASAAPLASLFSKEGVVEGQQPGATWNTVEVGKEFSESDSVRVGRIGRASIQFVDGGFIRLSNGSVLRFEGVRRETSSLGAKVSLDAGQAHFLNKLNGLEPEVTTPYVSAAARGTEFVVTVNSDNTTISVLSGSVLASNSFGTASARSGEQIFAAQGQPPLKRVLVDPREAVQWTLALPSRSFLSESLPSSLLSECLQRYVSGNRAVLSDCPASLARSLFEGIELLDGGNVPRASQLFTQIASDQSANREVRAAAFSMLSLLAVLSNQDVGAQQNLTQAQSLEPESPLTRYIASYVAQSRGDIEGARHALDGPSTPSFIQLRAVEIDLMRNDLSAATHELAGTKDLPHLSAERLILEGFIAIQERRLDDAKHALSESFRIDSRQARAQFGLGLVAAGQSDFDAALTHFLAAVSLDPSNASYRNYLSKVYFEQGAENRALEELAASISQDPQDPTPYLYRSFVELSQNRPIAALRSIEESIELNKNRAVYRSSNLLDQDLAVRSAGIGHIFTELGLQGPARNEALRSISLDYLNYSAHQLLADSSDSLNEADASISERRITSLLAPLSLNSLSNTGGRASFSEYSSLFDTSTVRTDWSFGWDGRDDIGAVEGSLALLEGPFGFSLLYQGAMADGSKSNDYSRDNRVLTTAEYQIRPESRVRLALDGRFIDFEDSYQSPQDSEFKGGAAELSYTEQLDAQTHWLSSVRVGRDDVDSGGIGERPGLLVDLFPEDPTDLDTIFTVDEDNDEEVFRLQASSQVIAERGQFSLVSGGQFNSIDTDRKETAVILDDTSGLFTFLPWQLRSDAQNDLRSFDTYSYLNYRPISWLTATGGASFTSLEYEPRPIAPYIDDSNRENHVSPKVGLLAEPIPGLLLRAAYFETLAKSSLEDQSAIEPTVVGGFSQRFNDLAGTLARAWAGGVDYKIPGDTYVGVEWIGRSLREDSVYALPVFDFDYSVPNVSQAIGAEDITEFSTQDLVRAYAAQILSERWVTGLEYQWSEFRRTDPIVFESQQTQRVGGAIRYFHPSGFFGAAKATWRSQDRLGGSIYTDGTEDFTIVDLAAGYRLPRRQGKFTLELLNIGDEQFDYDQSFGFEPFIASGFAIAGRMELSF